MVRWENAHIFARVKMFGSDGVARNCQLRGNFTFELVSGTCEISGQKYYVANKKNTYITDYFVISDKEAARDLIVEFDNGQLMYANHLWLFSIDKIMPSKLESSNLLLYDIHDDEVNMIGREICAKYPPSITTNN